MDSAFFFLCPQPPVTFEGKLNLNPVDLVYLYLYTRFCVGTVKMWFSSLQPHPNFKVGLMNTKKTFNTGIFPNILTSMNPLYEHFHYHFHLLHLYNIAECRWFMQYFSKTKTPFRIRLEIKQNKQNRPTDWCRFAARTASYFPPLEGESIKHLQDSTHDS